MPVLLFVAYVLAALVVLLAIALLAFSYWQARMLLTPVRRSIELRPADLGLSAQDVWIPSDRGKLAAWYVPPQNGCVLICCHGINDNRSQWVAQVAGLHRTRGYGAVLFDFSGHGESEGRLVTYGVREQEDVAAVLAYLRGRADPTVRAIGIMGYSLGAITAVLAAAEMAELQAVVIESGFADVERDLAALFRRYTGLPSCPFASLVVFWAERIGRGKARLSQIRPAQVIGRVAPRAVFIISDLKDAIADEPYDGEQLYAHAGEPRRLWQVPDAEHVQAFARHPDEWLALVGDFLDTYLAPHAQPQPPGASAAGASGSSAS